MLHKVSVLMIPKHKRFQFIPGSTLILLDYGVYSRDNLPNKIKDGAYAINPDEYFEVATHWIALYSLNNNVTYFDNFGVEHIPKEIRKFIDNESIINIFRIQPYDSVMSGYFCTGFIDFMPKDKNLSDFTNLFSPKMMILFRTILKIAEYNSPNTYPNLNNQQRFRLNKIKEIKDYFVVEIRER